MRPVLVFDIETVPDVAGLRRLHDFPAYLSDVHLVAIATRARQRTSALLPLHLQRIVAISCALRSTAGFRVWSLGDAQEEEGALIQRFFDGLAQYTPQLVSWNGGGFDLPVLHYRGLIHGVEAGRYWEMGEEDRDFKWNNYLSRYHTRHLDLMDLLSLYQIRSAAPLDELAQLMGFPGKLGMDGAQVWGAYRAGRLPEIRAYCETDVVNTYLVYLGFQKMRGLISTQTYQDERMRVRHTLAASSPIPWQAYLAAWDKCTNGLSHSAEVV